MVVVEGVVFANLTDEVFDLVTSRSKEGFLDLEELLLDSFRK